MPARADPQARFPSGVGHDGGDEPNRLLKHLFFRRLLKKVQMQGCVRGAE